MKWLGTLNEIFILNQKFVIRVKQVGRKIQTLLVQLLVVMIVLVSSTVMTSSHHVFKSTKNLKSFSINFLIIKIDKL